MHQHRVLGRGDQDHAVAGVRRHDIVGVGDGGRRRTVGAGRRPGARTSETAMVQERIALAPLGCASHAGRRIGSGVRCSRANRPRPAVLARGRMTLRKRSSIGTAIRLQQAAQGLGGVGRRGPRPPRPHAWPRRRGCPGHEPEQPLALLQEPVEPVGELAGIDDPQELEIVVLEHDAVVGRAPADMPAARGRVEAEPRILGARRLEVAHADDQVVDADQLVVQGADPPARGRGPICLR